MQKIKDGLYEISDFIQTVELALKQLNIADAIPLEPVLAAAVRKIDTLVDYVEEKGLKQ